MSKSTNKFMATIKMPRFNRDLIDAPEFPVTTQSGRVAFDDRGNSIWEWQTAPGVFTREISLQQLQALQAKELQVVEDDSVHTETGTFVWSRRTDPRKAESAKRTATPRGFESFMRLLGIPA